MTRFARAKGSKASNERRPEEATSWQDMRRQLELNQLENQQGRDGEFSEERPSWKHKIAKDSAHDQNENSVWTSFSDTSNEKSKKKNSKIKEVANGSSQQQIETSTLSSSNEKSNEKSSKKRKKPKSKNVENSLACSSVNELSPKDENEKKFTKIVKKKKGNIESEESIRVSRIIHNESENSEIIEEKNFGESEYTKNKKSKVILKDGKRKNKSHNEGDNEIPVNRKKVYKFDEEENNVVSEKGKTYNQNDKRDIGASNKHKLKDHADYKRRKPNPGSYTTFINGKNIDIVCYEGFFIKKEDAENLRKLRKQFIKKGIPRNELQAIMKLERRKAEKALAREKKKVCFQCRKSGHNLSECPELPNNESSVSGICFKCGSTEHTYFQCKVSRGEDFRFAKCFICKEEGHIAKQCPDNPRGLYPKGGACKICGDVTHLKKDCPDLQQKSENSGVTVEKFSGRSLDVLDEELDKEVKQTKKPLNKKIKFF